MKELHALVDFENVQPTLDELAKLAPGFTNVWLFHGPHQTKQAKQLEDAYSSVTPVPRSGKGKNALDFHLSFYLGYVAAKHPEAELVVVANDKGYDPMIAHARELGFTAKRVGYTPKPTPAAKATPAKQATALKVPKSPGAETPAKLVAKKASAKKVADKKVPAVKVAAPKAPVKKAAAKKSSPQQTAVKKAAPKPPRKKAPTSAKAKPAKTILASASDSEAKVFTRIQKGLVKMDSKAPTKLKSLRSHVKAMLGKDSTDVEVDKQITKLVAAKTLHIEGDAVTYPSKK
jgi:PIN domain